MAGVSRGGMVRPIPFRHAYAFASCPHLLVMPTPSRHAHTFSSCPHLLVMPTPSRHARTFAPCPHLLVMPAPSRHAHTFSPCPYLFVMPAKAGIQKRRSYERSPPPNYSCEATVISLTRPLFVHPHLPNAFSSRLCPFQ